MEFASVRNACARILRSYFSVGKKRKREKRLQIICQINRACKIFIATYAKITTTNFDGDSRSGITETEASALTDFSILSRAAAIPSECLQRTRWNYSGIRQMFIRNRLPLIILRKLSNTSDWTIWSRRAYDIRCKNIYINIFFFPVFFFCYHIIFL